MEKTMTLEQYREVRRRSRRRDEERDFRLHRRVYFTVVPLLVVVNLVFARQFPWSVFPLAGWGTGLILHYLLGIRKLAGDSRREEELIGTAAEATRGGW